MADRAAFETAARLFDRIDGLGHPLRGKPTGPDQPKRILIWTVDRIGDVVRGTLSVAALRRQFPHAVAPAIGPWANNASARCRSARDQG